MEKMGIQIVNINNLEYTKNVVSDLFRQTMPFDLTIIDQNSTEEGTDEFLCDLFRNHDVMVIKNRRNVELNYLWNLFHKHSKSEYLCFLNNDIRLTPNFVEDTIHIFEKVRRVGAVIHSTNHPRYKNITELDYIVLDDQYVQGWDFTLRREVFVNIPDDLKFFGGDDWLFNKMYAQGYKTACALSSPIIHYNAQSRKYYPGKREEDAAALKRYGIGRLPYLCPFTKKVPNYIWESPHSKKEVSNGRIIYFDPCT